MGTVWRAYDELLGRPVAVKELHVDAGTNTHPTLREARAVARVHHPHVVCVHDVVEEDGVPYIVMELVEGGSLAALVAAHGPVDTRRAAAVGLALLGALRAAHAIGVLHRDLKPANVLLEAATGRVVLTDFGVAQLAGATTITEAGTFVGSPEYTAPERMRGAQAGPETDLWSLGVLLCALLTGESPFHRDSLGGVLHAVVEGEFRPPPEAGPLLPVVRGLLERDPARRMGAVEAERLLAAYLATGIAPADPSPARPKGRRTPLMAAALLAAALAGAGAAGVVLLMRGSGDGDGDRRVPPSVTASPSVPASSSATGSPGAGPDGPGRSGAPGSGASSGPARNRPSPTAGPGSGRAPRPPSEPGGGSAPDPYRPPAPGGAPPAGERPGVPPLPVDPGAPLPAVPGVTALPGWPGVPVGGAPGFPIG
ncbi:protein kinase [Streptomyces sp. LP05-1]|uniref:non-specific serine/threonine protein kinase n=1 Tax=Streptomyces pyxinae TaxID=2970734 RepID=A0ABT2CI72_9ACTN|nr:protein kinase [Streptomyces sp. LP05-1]